MVYIPGKHRRRSIRLPGYDYSRPGGYFATLCVQNHECLFGHVSDGKMHLNALGRIADDFIFEIPKRYPGMVGDCHIVMPNHVHVVLMITDGVGRGAFPVGAIHDLPLQLPLHELPLQPPQIPYPLDPVEREKYRLQRRAMLIPKSVGFYRMNVSKRVNIIRGTPGIPLWQRNYHDNIIRTQQSLERIRRYIRSNPANWGKDKHNSDRLTKG
jgi:REP element-mobilizing transposase RayT